MSISGPTASAWKAAELVAKKFGRSIISLKDAKFALWVLAL